LETSTLFKWATGESEERRPTFDAARLRKETKFYRNGTLITTFVYDRFPNGTVRRTLALGPNGELMAEYPDLVVTTVDGDGHPIDHPDSGKIYKIGKWF